MLNILKYLKYNLSFIFPTIFLGLNSTGCYDIIHCPLSLSNPNNFNQFILPSLLSPDTNLIQYFLLLLHKTCFKLRISESVISLYDN